MGTAEAVVFSSTNGGCDGCSVRAQGFFVGLLGLCDVFYNVKDVHMYQIYDKNVSICLPAPQCMSLPFFWPYQYPPAPLDVDGMSSS